MSRFIPEFIVRTAERQIVRKHHRVQFFICPRLIVFRFIISRYYRLIFTFFLSPSLSLRNNVFVGAA
jgi:hypothetical protein